MKYKAIIFDIDGTAVINAPDAQPTKRLINAVAKAQQLAKVSAATGRPWSTAKLVIEPLHLTSACILAAGAQIIDPKNEKILWEKSLSEDSIKSILAVGSEYSFEVVPINNIIIYFEDVPLDILPEVLKKLEGISDIAVHQATGYVANTMTLDITHKNASKESALQKLIQMEGIKKEEIIGVGDSKNDLPLFASVGRKIAMGNASEELKNIADEIVATAKDDGLAQVIEKYFLQ